MITEENRTWIYGFKPFFSKILSVKIRVYPWRIAVSLYSSKLMVIRGQNSFFTACPGTYMTDFKTQNSTRSTQHFIDCHSHILPAIDDGAADLAESLAMARVLAGAGFGEVHCTPHSLPGAYEAAPVLIRRAVDELSRELDRAGIPLRLVAGAEYYCDEFLPARLDDPLPLGDSDLVLMEAPLQATATLLSHTAYQVVRRGFTPLIAHPERCAVLSTRKHKDPVPRSLLATMLRFANSTLSPHTSRLAPHTSGAEETTLVQLLRSMGCRFQGNIGSFAGVYGERVKGRAIRNLREGLYDCLGSDAHASRGLADWLGRGLAEVESQVGAEGLAALLAGCPSRNAGSTMRVLSL
jgi:protein-tyrosine phosphatase